MKNKTIKRMLALMLAAVMSLTACGQTTSSNAGTSETKTESKVESVVTSEPAKEETKEAPKEIVTVTMYPKSASIASGVVGDWKEQMLADIGVQLEVWAFSKDKTNAILASGELPDLFFVTSQDQVEVLLENDLLLDLTPYLDQFDCIGDYYSSWDTYVANQQAKDTGYAALFGNDDYAGKFYVMPNKAGDRKNGQESLQLYTDRNQVRLRWDAYEGIGAPAINNWSDLLDAVEKMWEYWPADEAGNKTYGMFLEDGSQSIETCWDQLNLWFLWNNRTDAYEKWGYIANYLTAEIEDVYADDGMYYQGLKFLNDAWNRGLIEPDSINTPRKDASLMTQNTVLPSGSLPGSAPNYLEFYMPGSTAYKSKAITKLVEGAKPATTGWVVSKDCENVDAVIDLLALWSDPNKALEWYWGPEGDIWYLDDNGNAMLTEAYINYAKNPTEDGFIMSTGDAWKYWNQNIIATNGSPTTYGNGQGGVQSNFVQEWKEYEFAAIGNSETFKQWQETTGYLSWQELLEDKEGALCTYSPVQHMESYIKAGVAKADDALTLVAQSCLTALQDYSWKMVVAPNEAEFNKLWTELKKTVEDYGIADVQKYFQGAWDDSMKQAIEDGYGPEGDMIVNWDELVSPWHK